MFNYLFSMTLAYFKTLGIIYGFLISQNCNMGSHVIFINLLAKEVKILDTSALPIKVTSNRLKSYKQQ